MWETAKLSMHIGSSRHYAKEIKALARAIRHDFDSMTDDESHVKEAVQKGDLEAVQKLFLDFLNKGIDQQEDLHKIQINEFTIEHRIIKHLDSVMHKLNDIVHDGNDDTIVQHKFEEIRKTFHGLVDSTRKAIKKKTRESQDLKRDHGKMRDKSIMTSMWLFHTLNVAAKMEEEQGRKERDDVPKILDELQEFMKLAHDKKAIDQQRIAELEKNLKEAAKEISEIFKFAVQVEHVVIVLEFRLRDLVQVKAQAQFKDLLSKGFPQKNYDEMAALVKKYGDRADEDAKDEYHYEVALYHEANI